MKSEFGRNKNESGAVLVEAAMSLLPMAFALSMFVDTMLVMLNYGMLTHNVATYAREVAEDVPTMTLSSGVEGRSIQRLAELTANGVRTPGTIVINSATYRVKRCDALNTISGQPSFNRVTFEATMNPSCVFCKFFAQQLTAEATTTVETGKKTC